MSEKVYLKHEDGGVERLAFPDDQTDKANSMPNTWVWLYQTETKIRASVKDAKAKTKEYALRIILPEQKIKSDDDKKTEKDFDDLVTWFSKSKVATNAIKDLQQVNGYTDKELTLSEAYFNVHQDIEKILNKVYSSNNSGNNKIDHNTELQIDKKSGMPEVKTPRDLLIIYLQLKSKVENKYGKWKEINPSVKDRQAAYESFRIIDSSSDYDFYKNSINSIFTDEKNKSNKDRLISGNIDLFTKLFFGFAAITKFIIENWEKLEGDNTPLTNVALNTPILEVINKKPTDDKELPTLIGWTDKSAANSKDGGLSVKIRKANTFNKETLESKAKRKQMANDAAEKAAKNGADMGEAYNDLEAFFYMTQIISNKVSLPGKPLDTRTSSFKLISLGKLTRNDISTALGNIGDLNLIEIYTVSSKAIPVKTDLKEDASSGNDNIVLSDEGPDFLRKSIEKYSKMFSKKSIIDKFADAKSEIKQNWDDADPKKMFNKIKRKVSDKLHDAWGEEDTKDSAKTADPIAGMGAADSTVDKMKNKEKDSDEKDKSKSDEKDKSKSDEKDSDEKDSDNQQMNISTANTIANTEINKFYDTYVKDESAENKIRSFYKQPFDESEFKKSIINELNGFFEKIINIFEKSSDEKAAKDQLKKENITQDEIINKLINVYKKFIDTSNKDKDVSNKDSKNNNDRLQLNSKYSNSIYMNLRKVLLESKIIHNKNIFSKIDHLLLEADMMDRNDLYKIFNVNKDASSKEIKRARNKLALKYHGDLNHDPEANEKMVQINAIYDILGNEDKRKEYDSMHENDLEDASNNDNSEDDNVDKEKDSNISSEIAENKFKELIKNIVSKILSKFKISIPESMNKPIHKKIIKESNNMILSQSKIIEKIIAKAMKQTHLSDKMLFTISKTSIIPAKVKSKIKEANSKASMGSASSTSICFKSNSESIDEIRMKIPEYQSKIATMIANNISIGTDESEANPNTFNAQNVLVADMADKEDSSGEIYFIIFIDKWVD